MANQLKKLLYNKQFVDSPDGGHIAEWTVAPYKIFAIIISLAVLLIVLYGWLFTTNKSDFFGNVIFYAIVILIAIAGLWIVGKKAWDFKQRITYFLIAFILLWVLYWVLAVIFDALGNPGGLHFHLGGTTLWIVLTLLAFIGAKRIDKSIDRNDILFGLMVLLVFIGSNITMTTTGTPPHPTGFLENVDNIIANILKYIKL